MKAFLEHIIGPVPDNITRLDESAEEEDQDEVLRSVEEASGRAPLESNILPSTVDNIAELIEQRSIED
eukprot:2409027-Karenia_brevis.AAC.1